MFSSLPVASNTNDLIMYFYLNNFDESQCCKMVENDLKPLALGNICSLPANGNYQNIVLSIIMFCGIALHFICCIVASCKIVIYN